MSKNFDELSEDFLNEDNDGQNNRKDNNRKREFSIDSENIPDDLPPEIKKIIDTIMNLKERGVDDIEDELNLGNPTEHETHEDDGNTFDKKTWDTDFGSISRISLEGDIPNGDDAESIINSFKKKLGLSIDKKKELTLDEKLEIAVEDENYMEAAKIRDEIRNKNEKNNSDEKSTDKGDSEGSLWELI